MSKKNIRIAKRYARALFEVVKPDDLDVTFEALASLAKAWEAGGDLRQTLTNPAIPLDARISALQEIGARLLQGKPVFTNFLAVLLRNGRLDLLPEVTIIFRQLIDNLKKLLALEITSAFPLEGAERTEMQDKIRQQFGSVATIDWKVDSSLIGGLVVKYGDRVLDNSVKGSLESLRTALVG